MTRIMTIYRLSAQFNKINNKLRSANKLNSYWWTWFW